MSNFEPFIKKTIITGCVRSGTTLALRVYCRDLTSDEEHHNSDVNEPGVLTDYIRSGEIDLARQCLPASLLNRHHLIESPDVAFILPYIEPSYQVIVIFRDLRLIIPSMLSHENVCRFALANPIYWKKYLDVDMPSDLVDRAISLAKGFCKKIIDYKGPIELWNYGFWDEWVVKSDIIAHLYKREKRETSERVLRDVVKGKIFSDLSFNLKVWKVFCDEFKCTKEQRDIVCASNERIKKLYKKRDLIVKTLDDA